MRRRWRITIALSALVVALMAAGYVGVTDPGRIGTLGDATYAAQCLADRGYQPNPGVCAHAFGAWDESHGEPALAVHPSDPNVIVMGTISRVPVTEQESPEEEEEATRPEEEVVAMLLGEEPRTRPAPTGPSCSGFGLCLHVTRDGGHDWHQVAFPRPDYAAMVGDPTLVFAPDGTLHIAGHRGDGGAIVYARTRDLGVTWDGLRTLVADEDQDRPWLTLRADTLVLTWQYGGGPDTPPEGIGAIWSDDGGDSWTRVDGMPTGCGLQSPAQPDGANTWLMTCERAPVPGRRIVRLDLDTNQAMVRDTDLDLGYGIGILSPAPGGFVVTDTGPLRWGGQTVHTRHSPDGHHWSDPVDLGRLTPLDDDWDWHWLSWAATDRAGHLHALLVGGPGAHCYNQRCDDPLDRQVVWVATDPVSGDRLGHALLTPTAPAERARARDHEVRATGDDYHSIVAYRDGVLIAWGHDGWTDLSWIAPL